MIQSDKPVVILAITGKALSGKDTLATVFTEILSKECHVHRFALADKLKQEATTALGVPLEYAYIQPYKEAIRPFLQTWGDMRKNEVIGGETFYWCRPLDRLIGDCVIKAHATDRLCVILITDIRYDFEAEYARSFVDANTIVVKVISTDNADTTEHNKHSSETQVDGVTVDYTVTNDKSCGIKNLYNLAERLIEHLNLIFLESSSSSENHSGTLGDSLLGTLP